MSSVASGSTATVGEQELEDTGPQSLAKLEVKIGCNNMFVGNTEGVIKLQVAITPKFAIFLI